MINIYFAESLENAAKSALVHVKNNFVIGLGSGSSVTKFVEALGGSDLNVSVIPSSLQIQLKAEEKGLRIIQPTHIPKIDLDVDGADQIDINLRLIKGGGGALLREKVLMRASKKVIIIADENKFVRHLETPVPLEVLPYARVAVWETLKQLGGNPKLRTFSKGYPYLTENGNIIFDTDFGVLNDPEGLVEEVNSIPGVAECGIFTEQIDLVYKAKRNGRVEMITSKP